MKERYQMLVSSLPALPRSLDVERLPISLERLEARLTMLEPPDADDMARLLATLHWANQFTDPDDVAVVRGFDMRVRDIANPFVRETLEHAMDLRMVGVALRCRAHGIDLPAVGIGRFDGHLRRHIQQPDFGLGHVFPWIPEAARLIAESRVLDLYRALLEASWRFFRRLAEDHYFDFEAVVLYVARWDCLRRWLALGEARGRELFETLVTETLGEHANLYA